MSTATCITGACLVGLLILAAPFATVDASQKLSCAAGAAYTGPALRTPALEGAFDVGELSAAPLDADTSRRLDDALIKAQAATKAPSVTAAVMVPGRGAWTSRLPASGGPPLHYWASAGKAFTAAAVMQLVDEGRLSLKAPISRWIRNVPDGDLITVEMLLDHTSGLFSANEDDGFRRRQRPLTAEAALAIARRHGPLFCPGTNWRYTNTGYTLLGAILERVDGAAYTEVLRRRVIARLHAPALRVLGPDDTLADVAPPASSTAEASIDPRVPGAAGAVAGDAWSMVVFQHALLRGRIVAPQTVRRMYARLYPMFDQSTSYGLGVMAYELPPVAPATSGEVWVGHSGGAPGVKAVVAYSRASRACVAVALTGDGSAEATANLLLRALGAPR